MIEFFNDFLFMLLSVLQNTCVYTWGNICLMIVEWCLIHQNFQQELLTQAKGATTNCITMDGCLKNHQQILKLSANMKVCLQIRKKCQLGGWGCQKSSKVAEVFY